MKQSKKRKPKKKITCKSDKSDTIKKRIAEKQKLFLTSYPKTACNVSLTCTTININRDTYYDWCKKYPKFAKACHDAEEGLVDRAESRLVECIDDHNVPAIIFFLCNKGKHRGWQNKHMIEGGDPNKPIRVVVQGVDLSKYPKAQETADSPQ